jgi:hypothetical protein
VLLLLSCREKKKIIKKISFKLFFRERSNHHIIIILITEKRMGLASRAEGEGEEGKKEFSTPAAWPLSPSDVY